MEVSSIPGLKAGRGLVVGRVYDVQKYFRVILLADRDRWKSLFMLAVEYVEDERVVMGHRPSPQTAQRLSCFICRFLQDAFDAEFFIALSGMSADTQRIVGA